jgi:hypothetical protein
MSVHEIGIVAISFLLTVSAYAANPFLDAKDDKPVLCVLPLTPPPEDPAVSRTGLSDRSRSMPPI